MEDRKRLGALPHPRGGAAARRPAQSRGRHHHHPHRLVQRGMEHAGGTPAQQRRCRVHADSRALARMQALAQQHADDHVALILNAEGLQTRQGLALDVPARAADAPALPHPDRLPDRAPTERAPRRRPGAGRAPLQPAGRGAVGGGALVPVGLSLCRAEGGAGSPLDPADRRGSGAPGRDAGRARVRPVADSRGPAGARAERRGGLRAGAGRAPGRLSCAGRCTLGVARQSRPAARSDTTVRHRFHRRRRPPAATLAEP